MGAYEVGLVFRHSQAKGGAKLTLATIAWFIRDRSNDCWPDYDTIAEHSGFGRSTVADHINKLENLGELIRVSAPIVRNSTGWAKASNHYHLPEAWISAKSS